LKERKQRAVNKRDQVAKKRQERAAQKRLEKEELKRQEEMDRERERLRLEQEELDRFENFIGLSIYLQKIQIKDFKKYDAFWLSTESFFENKLSILFIDGDRNGIVA